MVATFSIYADWGGSDNSPGTSTDIDGLGPPSCTFGEEDNADLDANMNPLDITDAGTHYSRWKHIYLKCDNADSHTMNNVRLYSTDAVNSLGGSIDVVVGDETPVKNSGASTGYDVSDTSDTELSAGHSEITGVTSIFDYADIDDSLTVSISEASNVIDAANETSNYTVWQLTATDSDAPGITAQDGGTFGYDEA